MKAYRKRIEREYKEVCQKIDNERELLCTGCGTSQHLSHSHIISRADCVRIGRIDLIADENNITLHCMSRCHKKWESKKIAIMKELLDFEVNMRYIKSIDIAFYNKIMNR